MPLTWQVVFLDDLRQNGPVTLPICFAQAIGNLLYEHLARQEDQRNAVSLLAAGAGFEEWLAFEARLVLESHRERLGLADTYSQDGHTFDRHWIGNEYSKVDLFISNTDHDTDRNPLAVIEFKLIHNNKNWASKVEEVRTDLFPLEGTKKARFRPELRAAFAGVVGKVYRVPDRYQGQQDDLDEWYEKLEKYLAQPGQAQDRMVRVWKSGRFLLKPSCWLQEGPRHFFELWGFMTAPQVTV